MSTHHEIKFGTDGWRGIIGDEFTYKNVRTVASAISHYIAESNNLNNTIIVGFDTRFSSDLFATAVAEIISSHNINVKIFSRPAPTPVCSYSVIQNNCQLGVMITASHNSHEWNGIKIKSEKGSSINPEIVTQVENIIEEVIIKKRTLRGKSNSEIHIFDPIPSYLEGIKKVVDIDQIKSSKLNIVVDNMHGSGAGLLSSLLSDGNIRITEIRSKANPKFPGMEKPEPIETNLKPLSQMVIKKGAHLGLAFDGDADRLGIIDENGKFVTTLEAFSALVNHFLGYRNETSGVACTITMSSMVDKLGENYNIPVYRTPVGFKYVGPKMMEKSCFIGGEESGGYAFKQHIPERDGILSALFFLEAMIIQKKKPSSLIAELQKQMGPHVFERADLSFPPNLRKTFELKIDQLSVDSIGGSEVVLKDRQDGIKLTLKDGSWLAIRMSGTEPLIRVYVESSDKTKIKKIFNDVFIKLKK